MSTLRLGSRGSQLALFQARLVAQRIAERGGPVAEIVVIKTSGDRLADAPLSDVGGKRLFVKEIEEALLAGDVDLAVHSSKDMPAALLEGLAISAVLPREDPADALVLPAAAPPSLDDIMARRGAGTRVGTGSVRRIAQLRRLLPDAAFLNIRGNLDTRLRKLDAGDYDLLVLASAGLRRLGFTSRISARLPLDECIPAPGQGIIAIETRADDEATRAHVGTVNDAEAAAALEAERALVLALGGGCQMPIGGVAVPEGSASLTLRAIVASLDGARVVRCEKTGPKHHPAALGQTVAEDLLSQGAAEILRDAQSPNPQSPNHPIPNPQSRIPNS
ncbi:MAG: hydroxymethylbilane synthase [Acidobacteria bacterium]|nr:hydroxymethylbilane synthase [Acidobacteriota bacterium]